jgi:antitoxin FitA
LERTVPTTLTLKNIPDDICERLKVAAAAHPRSLNSEAIVYLETVLMPTRMSAEERIACARWPRAGQGKRDLDHGGVEALKNKERP